LQQATGQAVEQQRHGNDRQPRAQAQAHFHAGQAAGRFRAQAAGTDQPGQHHHGQRQQDALVEAHQQGGQGAGQFDLEQDGARCGAGGLAEFEQVLGHLAKAQAGQAQHRRDAIDDGGDDRRHLAQAEDDHGRDQVHRAARSA
jgi:hypothetical protein